MEPNFAPPRPSIPILTSLRFFPALLVVIFHYNLSDALFPGFLANHGYDAVTFFFVLSGFILTYVHGIPFDGVLNISPGRFIVARLLRICPAYYLALTVIALLFYTVGILDRLSSIQTGLVLSMTQSWTPHFALSINPPAWSLSNEMLFYLLFPAIWGTTRHMSAVSALAITGAIVLSTAVLRGFLFDGDEGGHNFRAYFPLLNLPQFMWGMALGYLYLTAPQSRRAYSRLFLAGLGLLCSVCLLQSALGWMPDSATLCVGFGLLIFGAAGMQGGLQKFLSAPFFVILGEASYGIYILHFPVWLWWNHYTKIAYQLGWPSIIEFALYLLAVISSSVAVFVWIERPIGKVVRARHFAVKP
jgi:peptidoglycan/LPS O-acetylase OafA/YrhL